jgi:hypothetical protein
MTILTSLHGIDAGLIPGRNGNDSYTKLLLHCDGADASTTFTDSSLSAKSPTAVGNAQIDTAQFKFGTASGLFDGTLDYVSVPDNADWDLTADFTIDFWVRLNALVKEHTCYSRPDNLGGGNVEHMIRIDTTNRLDCFIRDGSGGGTIIGRLQPLDLHTTGVWYHIAYVRSGSNFYVFRDGIQLATTSTATAGGSTTYAINIGGRSDDTTASLNGWIDEFRYTKGLARWTANFAVPVRAYG